MDARIQFFIVAGKSRRTLAAAFYAPSTRHTCTRADASVGIFQPGWNTNRSRGAFWWWRTIGETRSPKRKHYRESSNGLFSQPDMDPRGPSVQIRLPVHQAGKRQQ